ncbi:MAG: TonB-dependent receptor, partial [Desulfuromusa sp.]|nr:TonB-dependent receptor [Desulfuromusa sp.]
AFTNTFSGHVDGVFHLLQDRWQLQVGSSLTKIDRDYPDSAWAKAFNGKKTKLELVNHFALNSQHTLVFGAETETETAETDFGVDEDATTNAFYLQDEFIAGAFNATVGVRQDRHDEFGSETTWRLSTGYSLAATGTRLKGSVGTGFKAPSLYQLFDPNNGNQNLKAEASLGYDIGIEQGLLDNSLILQVTWFHNDIDDYIQWDASGYQNAGNITTQGVETSLELYPAEFIDLRLNYTYTDSEDKDGNRLLRRPLHTGNFDLNFRFLEDKMVNFNILYIGERDDISETLDDYILVNRAASHQITDNLKGFVRVDNLFDEEYEEVAGYGTAGLSRYAGIKLAF